jgi:hypothetical protein
MDFSYEGVATSLVCGLSNSLCQPLQDKCEPTPYEDVEALFRSDMGVPASDLFGENIYFSACV